ncbi:GNAT family protein [Streptomyces sp. NPDC049970]|uniref:GNAT family N-acetyltransferase n=1 Tax=Streptomyces sp. NPDC049970 TaxID=3155033 RepID=UPI00344871F6
MNVVPELHGTHLRLRELRLDDRDTYVRIFTHRLLTRYLGIDRLDRRQAEESFVQALVQRGAESRSRHTLAVCPPSPGPDSMIGTIGLLREGYGSNAMITGLAVLPGSSVSGHTHEAGRLLLAYAFGHLGLHRVWTGHRSDHTRMRTVMHAAGFTQEATLRQLFRTGGIWHDVTTYTALAPEWKCQATQAETAILEGEWLTQPQPSRPPIPSCGERHSTAQPS